MQVKTFRARNLQQALIRVRQELGPDAAVLQTRSVQRGLFGIAGRGIEVTASNTVKVPSRLPDEPFNAFDAEGQSVAESAPPNSTLDNGDGTSGVMLRKTHRGNDPKAHSSLSSPSSPSSTTSTGSQNSPSSTSCHSNAAAEPFASKFRDRDRFTAPKFTSIAQPAKEPVDTRVAGQMSNALLAAFTQLLDQGFDTSTARQIIADLQRTSLPHELEDAWYINGQLLQWVRNRIRVGVPLQPVPPKPQVVALVGPTGVGKTTTIAKLAAEWTLNEQLPVGLITVDTFRIGAVEQLNRYAAIMDLPVEVIESEDQVAAALQRLSHCAVLFVDTAGRTPRDTEQLHRLKEILGWLQPHQTHLVLSSTSNTGSFTTAIERFRLLNPTHMLLTKLDESQGWANLLMSIEQSQLPISYVTTGQNVPNDIQQANSTRLASHLLGNIETSVF